MKKKQMMDNKVENEGLDRETLLNILIELIRTRARREFTEEVLRQRIEEERKLANSKGEMDSKREY